MSARANLTWDEVIKELWPDTTGHPQHLVTIKTRWWEILLPPGGIPNRNGDVFAFAPVASLQKQIEDRQTQYLKPQQERSEKTMLKNITLQVDALDYDAIAGAVKIRESWNSLPDAATDMDGDMSDHIGLVIAEICRGWLELHDSLAAKHSDDNPTVTLLRRLFAGDPNAITCLLTQTYVPCNQSVIDDPHAVAHATPCDALPQSFMLGALGLINGVLAANGLPEVATQWTHDCGGRLIGFQKYKPETKDEPAGCSKPTNENSAADEDDNGR